MAPIKLTPEGQPQVLDIRQGHSSFDLGEEIVSCMRHEPRSLPSLLLWDDQGLEHFDHFSQRPAYYPFHSEIEILRKYGSNIGSSIPVNGILLELGCGSIRKTKLLLSGLRKQNRPIHYFALDVSRESLEFNLGEMRREFESCPFITITGLLGTYDDCITWLSGLETAQEYKSVTIMFLGNSFGNMERYEEASFFLERFSIACRHAHLACRFIVSTDICQNDTKVLDAYNIQEPELQSFMLHALESANLVLEYKAFNLVDWTPSTWLETGERTLHFYVTAKRDLLVPLPVSATEIETVAIGKGERIRLVGSGKWGMGAMSGISEQAGFQIQHYWKDDAGDYYKYVSTHTGIWALKIG